MPRKQTTRRTKTAAKDRNAKCTTTTTWLRKKQAPETEVNTFLRNASFDQNRRILYCDQRYWGVLPTDEYYN